MNATPNYTRNILTGRANLLKGYIMNLLTFFYGPHRLLLEVFIRKNFGERYFKFSSAITVAIFLSLLPFLITTMQKTSHAHHIFSGGLGLGSEATAYEPNWIAFISWYIFIALFLYVSVKHWRAQRPSKSRFDFSKYSLYDGDLDERFFQWKFSFIETNVRTVECFFEPAPFFISGLFLVLIGQYLGYLLIISSTVYALSYINAYEQGDNYMLGILDQRILDEEFERVFVEGIEGKDARGINFRATVPGDKESRKQLLPYLTGQDDVFTAS